jgi:hypothetical protein
VEIGGKKNESHQIAKCSSARYPRVKSKPSCGMQESLLYFFIEKRVKQNWFEGVDHNRQNRNPRQVRFHARVFSKRVCRMTAAFFFFFDRDDYLCVVLMFENLLLGMFEMFMFSMCTSNQKQHKL